MKRVTLLGSTGSIGTSTLDVIRRWPDRFSVYALAAGQNIDLLVQQIKEFHPAVVVVASATNVSNLTSRLRAEGIPVPDVRTGTSALVEIAVAPEAEFVLSAIVGVAGLEATYEAVRRGKTVGLANKETLVASGQLVMDAAKQSGAELIPVDSEHNGAHQCLRAGRREEAVKLILTASGGPFRQTPREQLASVTPAQALKHPTWKMGQRITIDSASMMNKGFEVIEACWLFDFAPRDVEVAVHPQSSVHAMVEYADGSVIAQVSTTDMRMPIQYALTYPERADAPVPRMNWRETRTWEFYPPDFEKFPLLQAAYDAMNAGGAAGCTLNAADEIAVDAFLHEQISFTGMAEVVLDTLDRVSPTEPTSVGDVLEVDRHSREVARECVRQRAFARA